MTGKAVPVYTVAATPEGFAVERNGQIIKTPAGEALILPRKALAEAIAEEWRAQGDKVKPDTMPMMQFAATTLDMTRKNRKAVVDQVAGYASGDLLCFFAEGPEELIQRQQKAWQPALDWCAKRFDALLQTGQGIMPIEQSPDALRALHRAVEAFDGFRLTGLKQATEVSGSLVLGLGLAEKHLTAEQVFQAAELDTDFQAEKWGDDPVSTGRREGIRADLVACEVWFGLLG